MKLIKNKTKKSHFYFELLPFALLFLFLLLFMFHINIDKYSLQKTAFEKNVISLDKIYYFVEEQNFTENELLNDNLESNVDYFFINNLNKKTKNYIYNKIKTYNEKNFESCNYDNIPIFFNKKLYDENKNDYSLSCLITKKNEKDIVGKLKDFYLKNLEDYIKKNLDFNGLSKLSNSNLNLNYGKTKSDYFIILKNNFDLSENDNYFGNRISYTFTNKRIINFNSIITLINSTYKILPDLENNFKNDVPDCMLNLKSGNELDCFKKTFIETLKNDLSQKDFDIINNNFNFELEKIKLNSNKYYGLKFNVFNKNNDKLFSFGAIFLNNIPYSLVNFKLDNSKIFNDVVKVTIYKPTFKTTKDTSYVILYSYNDFRTNDYLKNILNDKKINENFNVLNVNDNFANVESIYYPKNSKLSVNMALTSSNGFVNGKKEILLNQIYNPNTKQFELLKNKKLYVFVFAVNSNNEYYLKGFEKRKDITITPKVITPPKPVKNYDVNLKGNFPELQNSLKVSVLNYNDNSFNHYDIYILKDFDNTKDTLSPFCKNVKSYKCYYYNGNGKLTSKKLNVLISSLPSNELSNLLSNNGIDDKTTKIINTDNFVSSDGNKFILQNGVKYEILIAPVNIYGKFVNKIFTFYEPPKVLSVKGLNYYRFQSTPAFTQFAVTFKPFSVTDTLPPNPKTSIILDANSFGTLNNYLFLSFKDNPDDLETISKIYGKLMIYDKSNNLLSSQEVYVTSNQNFLTSLNSGNKILFDTSKDGKAVLTNIYPVDSFDNTYYGLSNFNSNVQTYSLTYK